MAKLQIRRSGTIYATVALAKENLVKQLALAETKDGELLAARYYVNGTDAAGGIKTILGIKATGDNSNTIFDVDAIPSGVQAELDKIGYKITKKGTANEGMAATYVLEGSKVLDGSVEIDVPKVPVYSIVNVTEGLGANVKTAYQLTKDGVNEGPSIEIPKDSALLGVGLTKGAADNLPTFNAESKTFTEPETGTKKDVLAFAYSLADGTTQVVVIDVSSFLRESEFADGLKVENGIVSVKKDNTSEAFLSVGAEGVKVSGITDAISGAIQGLGSISAKENKYVTSVKVNTAGKLEATLAQVQAAQVAVADAGNKFTGTDVEAVLAELDAKINKVTSEAIGVADGDGIEITGEGTVKTIAVNITKTSATAASGKFLTEVSLEGTTLTGVETEVTAGVVKVTPITGKLDATNVQAAFEEVYQDIDAATATAGDGINVVGNQVSVKSADASIKVSDAGVAVDVIDCGTY